LVFGVDKAVHGKKRWLIYSLVGFLFGIADWYYLNFLAQLSWGKLQNNPIVIPIIILLNYGIWLVPVLPVTFYESRTSRSASRSALAGALCWVCSIAGYYIFYLLLLAFWGLPNMEYLLIQGSKQAGFWQAWSSAFQKIILNQVIEWLPIALIGGALVGISVWWFVARTKSIPSISESAQ
jgi:hypothetical protein